MLDVGRWTLDRWTLGPSGRWTLLDAVGRWTLDVGLWTLDGIEDDVQQRLLPINIHNQLFDVTQPSLADCLNRVRGEGESKSRRSQASATTHILLEKLRLAPRISEITVLNFQRIAS